ncbi:hypothetical protein U3516DRAFT_763846 [Neocallimastix sp. 'constans']
MAHSVIRIDFANRRITRRICWLNRNFTYLIILEKSMLSFLNGLSIIRFLLNKIKN